MRKQYCFDTFLRLLSRNHVLNTLYVVNVFTSSSSQIFTPLFLFDCLQLSCLSSHSSMLNIFAVFWNTGINWMIAYKMGWVVGFIYLHSQPQRSPLTLLPTLEHGRAAETVNEQHFIHSDLTTEKKRRVFLPLHPAFFSFGWWSQVNHCSTSFLGKSSQSSFYVNTLITHVMFESNKNGCVKCQNLTVVLYFSNSVDCSPSMLCEWCPGSQWQMMLSWMLMKGIWSMV